MCEARAKRAVIDRPYDADEDNPTVSAPCSPAPATQSSEGGGSVLNLQVDAEALDLELFVPHPREDFESLGGYLQTQGAFDEQLSLLKASATAAQLKLEYAGVEHKIETRFQVREPGEACDQSLDPPKTHGAIENTRCGV